LKRLENTLFGFSADLLNTKFKLLSVFLNSFKNCDLRSSKVFFISDSSSFLIRISASASLGIAFLRLPPLIFAI
jgi:hypothetical protein